MGERVAHSACLLQVGMRLPQRTLPCACSHNACMCAAMRQRAKRARTLRNCAANQAQKPATKTRLVKRSATPFPGNTGRASAAIMAICGCSPCCSRPSGLRASDQGTLGVLRGAELSRARGAATTHRHTRAPSSTLTLPADASAGGSAAEPPAPGPAAQPRTLGAPAEPASAGCRVPSWSRPVRVPTWTAGCCRLPQWQAIAAIRPPRGPHPPQLVRRPRPASSVGGEGEQRAGCGCCCRGGRRECCRKADAPRLHTPCRHHQRATPRRQAAFLPHSAGRTPRERLQKVVF